MGGRKTVGKIIGEAFRMYKRQFKVFFITVLIVYGFVYLIGQFSDSLIWGLGMDPAGIQARFSYNNLHDMFKSAESFLPLIPLLVITLSFTVLFASFSLRDLLMIPSDMISIYANDVMLHICYARKPGLRGILKNFGPNWKRYLGISAWSKLWQALWTLLFGVPGIIKMYGYMLAPYLIIEYPELTIRQALKKSMEITNGYKGRLFGLMVCLWSPWAVVSFVIGVVLVFSKQLSLYQLIVGIAAPIVSLFLLEPIQYAMITLVYLDIMHAAINRGLLQPSRSF